ncbi:MAG: SMI1/KNR4 family protein [Alphaproteobacteria bacterium]|nr:SMI1/KNR4 family protein [Alphaproteobacteria bacterium]MBU1526284.1 SMI1/KNR4 family protein [Alphaproteobacteria bacterium]MBU2351441.1 SMI1/KNR4 family protein [Alphaproteobacteria bacterium]MBU2382804.1 SMI1/KNR4 family protein [Alphaproteobacteria bacterium]
MNGSILRLREMDQRWGSSDYPPISVSGVDFVEAEIRLSWRFPEPYRQALLEVGLLRVTADLWEAIDEAEADLPHLGDFFSPAEAVAATEAWITNGMPDDLIAFAGDSGGNLFAFNRRGGDVVWYFDHDFQSVDQLASSFEAWLATYCRLAPA